MQRVEDVEHVFHLCFSAFAVVEGEEQDGEKREPLQGSKRDGVGAIIDGSYHQQKGNGTKSPRAVWQKVNGKGQQNSPHTVVDIKICAHQKLGENKHKKYHAGKGKNRSQTLPKLFAFQDAVNRINGNNRERKGDKNSLIKASHCHKINGLKDQCHGTYHAKVLGAILGVAATFGDHICKNREGDSANGAKDEDIGEEQKSYMVKRHAYHGNDFELIVRQPEFGFLN